MLDADSREMPRYDAPEVARYAHTRLTTLKSWLRGSEDRPAAIQRPSLGDPRLSYNNLIEAYVIQVLRAEMHVPWKAIWDGIDRVRKEHGVARPLLSDRLRARTGNLLFEALYGELLENVGLGGQLEIPEVVDQYLHRIEYQNGLPVRLYPVTRTNDPQSPRKIAIFPDISFGKPVTTERHISTAVIFDRFNAGESIQDLAEDYELTSDYIEEAIRTEGFSAAA